MGVEASGAVEGDGAPRWGRRDNHLRRASTPGEIVEPVGQARADACASPLCAHVEEGELREAVSELGYHDPETDQSFID